MPELTPARWAELTEGLAAADARFMHALRGLWHDVSEAVAAQEAIVAKVRARPPGSRTGEHLTTAASASFVVSMRKEIAEALATLTRARIGARALEAADAWHRDVSGWLRALPEHANVSGGALRVLAPPAGARLGWRGLAALDPRAHRLALRQLMGAAFVATAAERQRRDARVLQALAEACREVQLQGELAYRLLAAPDHPETASFERQRQAARATLQRRGLDAITLRERWREGVLLPRSLRGLATAAIGIRRHPRMRASDLKDLPTAWSRRLRDVLETVALESAALQIETEMEGLLLRTLDACAEERERLQGLLAHAARVVGTPTADHGTLSAVMTPVPVPTHTRVAEVGRGLRRLLQLVPETLELPRSPLAWLGLPRTRRVHPRQAVASHFDREVAADLQALLAEHEEEYRDGLGDLERVRAVIAFAVDAAPTGTADDAGRIVDEARQNARRLLEHRLATLGDRPLTSLQPRLRLLAFRALEPLHELISPDGGRLLLRRRRARLEARGQSLVLTLLAATGRALASAARLLGRLLGHLLIRIGWRAAPVRERSEVTRRPTLPDRLAGDEDGRSISALYAHLFRQDPVTELQFLIGRDTELEAVAEARARWEAGHAAAVLVVGERGSGKTSLLNCALLGPLAELPVLRTEFGERVTTPEKLREFLRGRLGVPEGATLETFLGETRRVVILEEVERSFLRQVGHYEAVRELQRLITATSRTTLWILVVNGIAFRLLDPAVRFGEVFSHRIDASAATVDELRSAIMFRHNLSGLRVRFEEASAGGRAAVLRRALRQGNAEEEFFAELAAVSDRVYRTAFSLWLRHLSLDAEGGIIVRRTDVSGADEVVAGLGHEHLFTLLAVLQHGSLTPEEHAAVFALPIAGSRSQLNDLLSRELLGPEDGRPGYRVRAEALPIVRQALYRRNLL